MSFRFTLCGLALEARAAGTLFVPDLATLIVADLHLGKAARMARQGGALLPPYETAQTLERLGAEIAATRPARVIALGDSFDDDAARALPPPEAAQLATLCAGRDWIWIAGNHDPAGAPEAMTLGPLVLRHIARPGARAEISGHFHPKARIGAGRARPAFLIDRDRVILPAFGTYTGGLSADDPALAGLMRADALAVLTGDRALAVPLAGLSPARGRRNGARQGARR
ncbi:ligase-associated DNA damage response endonuclease PdeM [Phaeovulum vinaykumarii]|uniref:Putative phosphoesterase n=1 Tax=Phaeovulum vinaykumarii TaxID=407234 RepID=A0A1N7K3E1_9RHOB|nr:ligase-associated DNA damage response endonuclease PdeM [Phaeovulum vinaykumarii]SIS56122.1 putative phosphoesterase [Phaeovulum vinaykumarii]SOB92720.1 putative phosphoesterase [Phaeovulum vinaykumarii]